MVSESKIIQGRIWIFKLEMKQVTVATCLNDIFTTLAHIKHPHTYTSSKEALGKAFRPLLMKKQKKNESMRHDSIGH